MDCHITLCGIIWQEDRQSNTSSSGFTKTNLMSYLARANYVYKDKYFVTTSIRFDGSSKIS